MSNKIVQIHRAILTEDIKELIKKDNIGISDGAIRQRLSRMQGVSKLKGYFTNGQTLFYNEDLNREEILQELFKAFRKAGKQYYVILSSLDFHHGYIKTSELASYSLSPVVDTKGHITFETVLNKLEERGIISTSEDCICLDGIVASKSVNEKKSHAIEVAKNFLLEQFKEWSRNIGMTSYDTATFHSQYAGYQFNFVSPSYIGTLPTHRKNNKPIPGFVVADILIENPIKKEQVDFFLGKVKAIKSKKGTFHFIPFLIVDSIQESEVINLLKSEGVVIGFVNEIFGKKHTELLKSLVNLITNAGAILKNNAKDYLKLMEQLNKLTKGKTNNLRGDLFELAVGYYYGRICQSIDIGKIINHDGERREVDVFAVENNKITFAECKGYKSQIDKEEIEKWLGEKVPVIRKWALEIEPYQNKEFVFSFWSTGGFTDKALNLLTERSEKTKKYKIEFLNLNSMQEKASQMDLKKFSDLLKEYYVKEDKI